MWQLAPTYPKLPKLVQNLIKNKSQVKYQNSILNLSQLIPEKKIKQSIPKIPSSLYPTQQSFSLDSHKFRIRDTHSSLLIIFIIFFPVETITTTLSFIN